MMILSTWKDALQMLAWPASISNETLSSKWAKRITPCSSFSDGSDRGHFHPSGGDYFDGYASALWRVKWCGTHSG